MASALLGTLGTIGSSLIGNLLSKGAETIGDVASKKLDMWKKQTANSKNIGGNIVRRIDNDITGIKKRLDKVEAFQ